MSLQGLGSFLDKFDILNRFKNRKLVYKIAFLIFGTISIIRAINLFFGLKNLPNNAVNHNIVEFTFNNSVTLVILVILMVCELFILFYKNSYEFRILSIDEINENNKKTLDISFYNQSSKTIQLKKIRASFRYLPPLTCSVRIGEKVQFDNEIELIFNIEGYDKVESDFEISQIRMINRNGVDNTYCDCKITINAINTDGTSFCNGDLIYSLKLVDSNGLVYDFLKPRRWKYNNDKKYSKFDSYISDVYLNNELNYSALYKKWFLMVDPMGYSKNKVIGKIKKIYYDYIFAFFIK